MATKTDRFDYLFHSSGEAVTAAKLRGMQGGILDTYLDALSDQYRLPRNPSGSTGGAKQAGVVEGFDRSLGFASMIVGIGRGLGFTLTDATSPYVPVPLETLTSVTLSNGSASKRYDLVYAYTTLATGSMATSGVRLSDGTLTTSLLPRVNAYTVTIDVVEGTPGGSAPSLPATYGYVPLYVIEVPALETIAANCTAWDVRNWLAPRNSLSDSFHWKGVSDSSATGVLYSSITSGSSTPNIKLAKELTTTLSGSSTIKFHTPHGIYSNTNVYASAYYDTSTIYTQQCASGYSVKGGGSVDEWTVIVANNYWSSPHWVDGVITDNGTLSFRVDFIRAI